MALPESDPDLTGREPRHQLIAALGWAAKGAACVSGAWVLGLIASWSLFHTTLSDMRGLEVADGALLMATGGALSGLVVGAVIGTMSLRKPDRSALALSLAGAICGSFGGGLTVPTIDLCNRWLHPLVSSALVWAFVGSGAGLIGFYWSRWAVAGAEIAGRDGAAEAGEDAQRGTLGGAAGWAFTSGLCTGVVWAAALGLARLLFGASFLSERLEKSDPALSVEFVMLGAVYGVLVGGSAGFLRRSERPTLPTVLGIVGGFFGALAGAMSVLAATTVGPAAHPILSSSLAVSAVGFVAGLVGYGWSRYTAKSTEPGDEDEDASEAPRIKIEWLLRRPERRPLNRALVRVLPVVVTSAGIMGAAVFVAPSSLALALLAVGALGSSVGVVLYRQENRLDALERRFRGARE